jgi:hypothetical protein
VRYSETEIRRIFNRRAGGQKSKSPKELTPLVSLCLPDLIELRAEE